MFKFSLIGCISTRLFLSACVLVLTPALKAQETLEEFLKLDYSAPGTITMKSGEIISGEINYDYVLGFVQVKKDSETDYINERLIARMQLEWFDDPKEATFINLKISGVERLYRLLSEGDKVAFLSYFDIETKQLQQGESYRQYRDEFRLQKTEAEKEGRVTIITRMSEEFIYVTPDLKTENLGSFEIIARILSRNNQFKTLSRLREKKLIEQLCYFDPSLETYIRRARLDVKKREDLIQLFKAVTSPESR